MSNDLPAAIQFEIDRWLEQQNCAPKNWQAKPVVGSGHSNARIWRLGKQVRNTIIDSEAIQNQRSSKSFAIRNWGRSPEYRSSIERILFFQKAASLAFIDPTSASLLSLSITDNDSIVPDVLQWVNQSFCLEHADLIWTIETWCPGTALATNAFVTDSLLDQAFDAIGRLHATGIRLGTQRIVPPGIIERSNRIREWTTTASKWKSGIERIKTASPTNFFCECSLVLERVVEHLHHNAALLQQQLQRWLKPIDCHWIVRDLWRENVLIEQDSITGIVDFGAARIDWPPLDIVRLLSSWLSPDDPRIRTLLEGHHLLTPEDFHFFDHLSTLLSLLQWFDWIINASISIERREDQIRSRIMELDHRLDFFVSSHR